MVTLQNSETLETIDCKFLGHTQLMDLGAILIVPLPDRIICKCGSHLNWRKVDGCISKRLRLVSSLTK
jgi:hypothetical protein